MESEWFTAKQLTEIAPLPTTPQGVAFTCEKIGMDKA